MAKAGSPCLCPCASRIAGFLFRVEVPSVLQAKHGVAAFGAACANIGRLIFASGCPSDGTPCSGDISEETQRDYVPRSVKEEKNAPNFVPTQDGNLELKQNTVRPSYFA